MDKNLLHYTKEKGPKAARVIGYTLGYNDSPDWVGDGYLFQRLMNLGGETLASPSIRVTGSRQAMRECEVELTPFGQQVLSGKSNQVLENGIDDWIGGVHLISPGNVVFRDGDLLVHP